PVTWHSPRLHPNRDLLSDPDTPRPGQGRQGSVGAGRFGCNPLGGAGREARECAGYPCLSAVAPLPARGRRESAAVRTLRAAAGGFLHCGTGGGIGGEPCTYVLPRSSETAAAIRHAAMAKPKAAARPWANAGPMTEGKKRRPVR